MRKEDDPRIIVIGAGMSGILSAIKLREAGYRDVTVYEKADRLGGTWRDNTYPGLTCDVPSHLYRYTFAANPDWTRRFPPGAEIRGYFEGVAAQYGVDELIRYNAEITEARHGPGGWRLGFADGREDRADVVIAATGVLREPVYPDIPGLDSFAGACFHSARWDHSVDLAGKRVGVIGTGSTGVQIVSAIVSRTAHLSLFQRTAQWILPLPNPEIPEEQKAHFRAHPEQMDALYDDLAERFQNTFARAVVGDREELAKIEKACRDNLEENVHDPELRARLTPDYVAACKRLIMSDAFYPAIQQPNASLVTEAIAGIEPAGVRTRDGTLHELDVLVLATGFDGHSFMRPMRVFGNDGLSLEEAWSEATEAYRSVAIPGFPNFFMLVGPNSPIGNFSLIMISELQLAYILKLIDRVRAEPGITLAPRAEATRRFNDAVMQAMENTVWVSGCRSWYLDKNGNPAMWPWSFEKFQADMAQPVWEDYDLAAAAP